MTPEDPSAHVDMMVAEIPGHRPLMLDLRLPAGASGPVPLVIWIHGGAWLSGTNKHPAPPLAGARIPDRLLAAGYAVAAVTYRLSAEARFPAQLHDVKAAVRRLRADAPELGLDPSRFAVWGESAGGLLAALIALTGDRADLAGEVGVTGVSDAVKSAVVWYGPSNLLTMQAQAHPEAPMDHDAPDSPESLLIGGAVQENPDEARAASPVTYATAQAPAIRLVHGAEDRIVAAGQSVELHERLTGAGAPAELRLVAGADHCFVGVPVGPLVDDALDFFRRTIGDASRKGTDHDKIVSNGF
ncbi:alpha/beta hydrolase [Planotetraspora mira]|uniref:BD-FAE-like domain-containing protein n=1 Tax=Planotetraspora mira TaxID=58121 RepID=A0A8J3TPH2_9ACTN|nr:alpha/beta hydrolase [Planotetraspora mira]GII30118.1 hypothetical protein Pmi06nite_35600 [Planotetraspora mira]